MSDKSLSQQEPGSEIVFYQTKDGRNRIEVRLDREMVKESLTVTPEWQ